MSNGKGIGVIEVEANIAKGAGSNVYERWNKVKAAIKVLVVLLLIPFGILTLKNAFPDQYNVILFNDIMFILLLIILFLGTILYGFIIFPHGQETNQKTKGEKTLVTEEKLTKYFTHIIALVITIPLIVVTCIILVGGNHSEELTFISGILGVIIGFYFGHRGVESAESLKDTAIGEKDNAFRLCKQAEQVRASSIEEETIEANKKLLPYPEERAWDQFREQVKNKYKKEEGDFREVGNIDKYQPWKEPDDGWNEKEKELITRFEEEWKLWGGE